MHATAFRHSRNDWGSVLCQKIELHLLFSLSFTPRALKSCSRTTDFQKRPYNCTSNAAHYIVPSAQLLRVLPFRNVQQFNLRPLHRRTPCPSLSLSFSSISWLSRVKAVFPFTKNFLLLPGLTASHLAPPSISSRIRAQKCQACGRRRTSTLKNKSPASLSRCFTHRRLLDASSLSILGSADPSPHQNPNSPPAFWSLQRAPSASTLSGPLRRAALQQDLDHEPRLIALQKEKTSLTDGLENF